MNPEDLPPAQYLRWLTEDRPLKDPNWDLRNLHCGICGHELVRVTFAWGIGDRHQEYSAVLCKNDQCVRSVPAGWSVL